MLDEHSERRLGSIKAHDLRCGVAMDVYGSLGGLLGHTRIEKTHVSSTAAVEPH
jgi:hypothetical protein